MFIDKTKRVYPLPHPGHKWAFVTTACTQICIFACILAAYPAAYGQFQQALTQHATLLPTGQKEGELKGKCQPTLFIHFITWSHCTSTSVLIRCWFSMTQRRVLAAARKSADVIIQLVLLKSTNPSRRFIMYPSSTNHIVPFLSPFLHFTLLAVNLNSCTKWFQGASFCIVARRNFSVKTSGKFKVHPQNPKANHHGFYHMVVCFWVWSCRIGLERSSWFATIHFAVDSIIWCIIFCWPSMNISQPHYSLAPIKCCLVHCTWWLFYII